MTFKGFSGKENFTQIPNEFFQELLDQIDDLNELKVILYALWRVANMEGTAHPLWERDFAEGLDAADISSGLEKCILRGSLLKVTVNAEEIYFLNSPRGKAAAESARAGDWIPSKGSSAPPLSRPNIYQLYEENIGPLTPLLADTLKDAEDEHPAERIEEAIALAVKANARKWSYVEAILTRWKEEGYGKKQDRKNDSENRDRYIQGDYADFIE
ncbi:MAG: DnaD domain protein [Anaerolineales bacterium]|uniref:DnaD domain protein n=1 Tax=Candidatus Desulfolinea nitratireducens TaxID=2841698 RepID=A0A8J6TJI0_9CHLR|nr:DnaD domain protein [Candidatus Desulfolinea nitratireducens]